MRSAMRDRVGRTPFELLGQARRRAKIMPAPRPRSSKAQVEGSGTGVKLERVRAFPEKLTRKEPSESVVVRRRPVVVTLAKVPVRAAAEAKKTFGTVRGRHGCNHRGQCLSITAKISPMAHGFPEETLPGRPRDLGKRLGRWAGSRADAGQRTGGGRLRGADRGGSVGCKHPTSAEGTERIGRKSRCSSAGVWV